jgi:hypothetical protein
MEEYAKGQRCKRPKKKKWHEGAQLAAEQEKNKNKNR